MGHKAPIWSALVFPYSATQGLAIPHWWSKSASWCALLIVTRCPGTTWWRGRKRLPRLPKPRLNRQVEGLRFLRAKPQCVVLVRVSWAPSLKKWMTKQLLRPGSIIHFVPKMIPSQVEECHRAATHFLDDLARMNGMPYGRFATRGSLWGSLPGPLSFGSGFHLFVLRSLCYAVEWCAFVWNSTWRAYIYHRCMVSCSTHVFKEIGVTILAAFPHVIIWNMWFSLRRIAIILYHIRPHCQVIKHRARSCWDCGFHGVPIWVGTYRTYRLSEIVRVIGFEMLWAVGGCLFAAGLAMGFVGLVGIYV